MVLSNAVFLSGTAGVHLHELLVAGKSAPGNTGAVLVGDLLQPTIVLVLRGLHVRPHAAGVA